MSTQPASQQRNVFFSYDHDYDPLSIAPVRVIEVTDEVRRQDEEKRRQRESQVTWRFRPSNPKPRRIVAKAPDPHPKRVCRYCGHRSKGCICRHQEPSKCSQCAKPLSFRNQVGMCQGCSRKAKRLPVASKWTESVCQGCKKVISRGATHKDFCTKCRARRKHGEV